MLASVGDWLTSDFAQAVYANVIAGAVVAVVVLVAIELRLRRAERRKERAELVHPVLREVKQELDHNETQAKALLDHAPEGDELPFPLFDVNGWTLLMQPDVLIALDAETVELLVMTYNRLRTSNDAWRLGYDLLNGPTAALAHLIDRSIEQPGSPYSNHRGLVFAALVDRVGELRDVLQLTRERVDVRLAELERPAPEAAPQLAGGEAVRAHARAGRRVVVPYAARSRLFEAEAT